MTPHEDDYGQAAPFRSPEPAPLLHRALPVVKELPRYRGSGARRDVVAGVTVAALAVPSAMAYAEVSGVAPINGLYALLLAPVAYALLGSSRQVSVGPEGSLAALVGAAVLAHEAAGSAQAGALAAMLALIVAGCFLLARVLRLAWVADYLSRPVLVGYIHGVAVVLVIGQLGKLLGLDISAGDPLPQLVEVIRELGSTSLATLAVGAVALALLIALRTFARKLPGA
ncbi:MAG TPA: SulP family inorganic anion transporter, partial [Solirubrobacter sp.]